VNETKMNGVSEYCEEMAVRLAITDNGRWVVRALNEGGYNSTEVDLFELLEWLRCNRPDLLTPNDSFKRGSAEG
jgi:predicted type IV restriction endonuclease